MALPKPTSLTIVIIIGHWFGLLSLLLVLIAYWPRRRIFPANIAFHHILSIIGALFSWTFNVFSVYSITPQYSVCLTQSILLNYFSCAGVIWTAIHSYNMHRYILEGVRARALIKLVPRYILLGWIFPIIPTVIGMTASDIGIRSLWCWIVRPRYMQLVALYFYFIIAIIVNSYWSGTLVVRLYRAAKKCGFNLKASTVLRIILSSFLFGALFLCVSIALMIRIIRNNDSENRELWLPEIMSGIISYFWGLFFLSAPDVAAFYMNKAKKYCFCLQQLQKDEKLVDEIESMTQTIEESIVRSNDDEHSQLSNRNNNNNNNNDNNNNDICDEIYRSDRTQSTVILRAFDKYNKSMFIGCWNVNPLWDLQFNISVTEFENNNSELPTIPSIIINNSPSHKSENKNRIDRAKTAPDDVVSQEHSTSSSTRSSIIAKSGKSSDWRLRMLAMRTTDHPDIALSILEEEAREQTAHRRQISDYTTAQFSRTRSKTDGMTFSSKSRHKKNNTRAINDVVFIDDIIEENENENSNDDMNNINNELQIY